jgi:L-Ala-D/L-Glu epimerase
MSDNSLKLAFRPLLLELRHPFRLATGVRTHTNAVLTEISAAGQTGRGEAAMPPYYGENHDTATAFLRLAQGCLARHRIPFSIADIMSEVDTLRPGNHAAKAAVDIALHDLWGKLEGKPTAALLGNTASEMPLCSFTLGIDTPAVLRGKMLESTAFSVIKIKLGTDDDRQIVRTIREITDKPIYVDANQGLKDREAALDMVHWLEGQNVQLVEQPFGKDALDDSAWLTERSPLPVFADESFQRLSDLPRVRGAFHGINVKLMKCTGLNEGFRCVEAARSAGMRVMIGCMTETSCGILAATQMASLCDFADLDGCWLIRNNPFQMPILKNGRVMRSPGAGLGLVDNLEEGK